MSAVRTAAAVMTAEWRALLRQRVARVASLLLLALTLAASLVSHEQVRAIELERARFQTSADRHWNEQPERHPHRVVHYGHYVFRPLSALAFFDPGVDPYTGHTLFLEGHRQNSANFSEAVQSSVLLRFGQLTPAFVLQVLAPLLIVFLAFGSVAREREQGQLRLLIAQGASSGALLAGKLAAHGLVALLLVLPGLGALAVIGLTTPAVAGQAAWMALGYSMYLLLWSALAVLVSSSMPRARDALLALAGCWIVTVVALPRVLPDLAARSVERPTRIESEAAIAKRLKEIGDSHNPDDPHFQAFRARVLAQYGVARVEDLPVNYSGLLMAEGERLTSELFEQAMVDDFARQERQSALVRQAAMFSPVIALRGLSMALAGTDGASHAHFLLEAERYRYRLIQALNHLHATQVAAHNDKEQRLANQHWQEMPRFAYAAAPLEDQLARGLHPALLPLGAWIVVLGAGAFWVARGLDREASMSRLRMELQLVLGSGLACGAVLVLLLLSLLAMASGLAAAEAQRAALARIAASHGAERAQVIEQQIGHHPEREQAGYAAYYTPHLTTNPPSSLAYLAWGQRDVQPAALRVRLLGLQAQLYESEAVNAELALPGRFDFSFVLVYLAPLFVIALMHDLVAGEREAGRLRLLASSPAGIGRLWAWRVGLRFALVFAALVLPLLGGAVLSGVAFAPLCLIVLVVVLYLGFWFGVASAVAARARSSAAAAALLLATLIGLTMVLPTVVNAVVNRMVPVARGVELALAQRQAVHAGWDRPKAETFAQFFRTHPQWRGTPPVSGRFHWKWYYAMHQAGDDAVAPQLAQYRQALADRELWTTRAGYLLAPVAVQVLLHRLADTDLRAQSVYLDRITAFHTRLRQYFYPFLFHERPFGKQEFARMPRYGAAAPGPSLPLVPVLALALLAALALGWGLGRLGRVRGASAADA